MPRAFGSACSAPKLALFTLLWDMLEQAQCAVVDKAWDPEPGRWLSSGSSAQGEAGVCQRESQRQLLGDAQPVTDHWPSFLLRVRATGVGKG